MKTSTHNGHFWTGLDNPVHLWDDQKHRLHCKTSHPTSVSDLTNALVAQLAQIYTHMDLKCKTQRQIVNDNSIFVFSYIFWWKLIWLCFVICHSFSLFAIVFLIVVSFLFVFVFLFVNVFCISGSLYKSPSHASKSSGNPFCSVLNIYKSKYVKHY